MTGTTRVRSFTTAAVLTVVLCTGPAAAGEPIVSSGVEDTTTLALLGSEVRLSGPRAAADDEDPAVAYDATTHRYLVVWQDDRSAGSRGHDIYGQLVSSDGAMVGWNFRICGPQAIGDDWTPAVEYNPTAGEYLVVWSDGRDWGTRGTDVYGQRVAADGTLLGANFRISGPQATSNEGSPALVYNPALDHYLVVWTDRRSFALRGMDIYGQQVSSAGMRAGTNFRISGGAATADDFDPAVAYNPAASQYLVVWQDSRNRDTRGLDIYGQRIAGSWTRAGGNFRISGGAATGSEYDPKVVHNPAAGQYLVVWVDYRAGVDVYAQRVGAGGARLGANFQVSGSGGTVAELRPEVEYSTWSGEYLVIWADYRNADTRGVDVFGQRLAAGGGRFGRNFRISGPLAVEDATDPAIAYGSLNREFFVVWEDHRDIPIRGYDVYARRVG